MLWAIACLMPLAVVLLFSQETPTIVSAFKAANRRSTTSHKLVDIGRSSFHLYSSTTNNNAPKLDYDEDFYSVLEVDPAIDGKKLKKAYYKLVFKYHPDNKEGGDVKDLCNRQMMVINAAYKVLKNDHLRSQYDIRRSMGQYGARAGVKEGMGKSATTSPSSDTTGSSSRTGSYSRQQNQRRRTRDASSYNEQFGDWVNYGRGTATGTNDRGGFQPPEETESFADILSDLFNDIALNKGANIANDINEFLEDVLEAGTGTAATAGRSTRRATATATGAGTYDDSSMNDEQLESEIIVLQTASKHLKEHITDLRSTLSVEETLLAFSAAKTNEVQQPAVAAGNTNAEKSPEQLQQEKLQELEERLRRQESIKSIKARLSESEVRYIAVLLV